MENSVNSNKHAGWVELYGPVRICLTASVAKKRCHCNWMSPQCTLSYVDLYGSAIRTHASADLPAPLSAPSSSGTSTPFSVHAISSSGAWTPPPELGSMHTSLVALHLTHTRPACTLKLHRLQALDRLDQHQMCIASGRRDLRGFCMVCLR